MDLELRESRKARSLAAKERGAAKSAAPLPYLTLERYRSGTSFLEPRLLSFGNRWCSLCCGPHYLSVFAKPNKCPASSHLQERYRK